MGAKTFHLCNQSLALEYLKDQLGFLVTIILGGNSLIHKNKKPRNQFPAPEKVAATSSPRKGAIVCMLSSRISNSK
jgi:hypothetical protein